LERFSYAHRIGADLEVKFGLVPIPLRLRKRTIGIFSKNYFFFNPVVTAALEAAIYARCEERVSARLKRVVEPFRRSGNGSLRR
jgi:hypothetical protein